MAKRIKAFEKNSFLYYSVFIIGYVLLLALCMFMIMKFMQSVEGGQIPPFLSWLKGMGLCCLIMGIFFFLGHLSDDYDHK